MKMFNLKKIHERIRLFAKNSSLSNFRNKKHRSDEKTKKLIDTFSEIVKSMENFLRVSIVGVGNDLSGDDGAGWMVIEEVKKKISDPGRLILIKTTSPENHVDDVLDFSPHLCVVVMPVDMGKRAGSIIVMELRDLSRDKSKWSERIKTFIRMYREGKLDTKFVIIGIQKSGETGYSNRVKRSVHKLSNLLVRLYRKGEIVDVEKEVRYMANPLLRIVDYFKNTKVSYA